ncbi:hypothetical protein QWZ14_22745, partial [Paeniroseomonas aquatica]
MDALSEVENRVVLAWREGGSCTLGDGTVPQSALAEMTVRAEVIRRALLCLTLPGGSEPGWGPPGALVLQGAWIEGDLDLRNARGAHGGATVALILTRCHFAGRIRLESGQFAALSVEGSRFAVLEGEHATFEGLVNLSEVSSAELGNVATGCEGDGTWQGLCWVRLGRCSIEGPLLAKAAKLCAPPYAMDADYSGGGVPYALDLGNTTIQGDVVCQPDFHARGGVRLNSASVRGSLYLAGGLLSAESGYALTLERATISGSLGLGALHRRNRNPMPFRAEGCIRLYGAKIEGELWLAGAELIPSTRGAPQNRGESVIAFQAEIRQQARLIPCHADDGTSASIPFSAGGTLNFERASLGALELFGAQVRSPTNGICLNLCYATISGTCSIAATEGWKVEQGSKTRIEFPSRLEGLIHAEEMQVSGAFSITKTEIVSPDGFSVALFLRAATIGGDCSVTASTLRAQGAQSSSVYLQGSSIGGHMTLRDLQLAGVVNLELCHIKGRIAMQELTIDAKPFSIQANNLAWIIREADSKRR